MMYPIAVISIMGLHSPALTWCWFKVFIADGGKEFHQLVSDCIFYIRK